MELKMLRDYVLLKEEENPFIERKTASGIITSVGDAFVESQDSGDMEQLNRIIGFGVVINVGPEVKYVKVGDGVYYDRRSMRALPFGNEPGWHINESNLLGYIVDEDGSVQAAIDKFWEDQKAAARKASFEVPAGFGYNNGDGRIIN